MNLVKCFWSAGAAGWEVTGMLLHTALCRQSGAGSEAARGDSALHHVPVRALRVT